MFELMLFDGYGKLKAVELHDEHVLAARSGENRQMLTDGNCFEITEIFQIGDEVRDTPFRAGQAMPTGIVRRLIRTIEVYYPERGKRVWYQPERLERVGPEPNR
jgi:hypothetical protein